MASPDGVRSFYGTPQLRRRRAVPLVVRGPLLGPGAIHGLDGDAHRWRRALFRRCPTPGCAAWSTWPIRNGPSRSSVGCLTAAAEPEVDGDCCADPNRGDEADRDPHASTRDQDGRPHAHPRAADLDPPRALVGPALTAPPGTGRPADERLSPAPGRVSLSSLRDDYPATAGQHGRPDGPEAHQPTNDQQAQRPDDVPPIQQMRRPLATQPVPPNPIVGDCVQHPKLLARRRPPPRPATTNRTVTHRFTDPHLDTSSPSDNPSNRTHRG
jgi:hypothetical protein